MAEASARAARVARLLSAARTLSRSQTREGRALRARLATTSGLSAENIELGLSLCLETQISPRELEQLLASTPEAPRAHVLLSANVFVASLRAIAIGVAASARVQVRASRRDPALAEALHDLAPELFELTPRLAPRPGEHVWSYGADQTLLDVKASLPRGVWFHEHGAGFGAVVLDASSAEPMAARAVALDTALFDQRGCLSPRVVCVQGSPDRAAAFARSLASELSRLERELPLGPRSSAELAEARKNRDAAAYAFELFDAGSGWVSLSSELVVPPAARNLHVVATDDAIATLVPFTSHLTSIGTNARAPLRQRLGRAFSGARLCSLGEMQRPGLDGPVDRRHGTRGELLS